MKNSIKLLLFSALSVLLVSCGSSYLFLEPVNGDFVKNELKVSDKDYYILVCQKGEAQCEQLKTDLEKEKDTLKADLYYLDTTGYIQNINNEKNTDALTNAYINDFKEILYHANATSGTSLIYHSKDKTNELKNYFDQSYYDALSKGNPTDQLLKGYLTNLKAFISNNK